MKKFNKKGQLTDIAEVGENSLKLILGGMVLIIILFISLTIYGALNGSSIITTPEAQAIFDILQDLPALADWGFLLFFGGVMLSSLVFYALKEFTPIEYVVSWIFVIIFSFLLFIIGYFGQQFLTNSAFSTVIAQTTFIPFFVNNSFMLGAIYFFISLTAMHISKT